MKKKKDTQKTSNQAMKKVERKKEACTCEGATKYDKVILVTAICIIVVLVSIIAYLIYKGNHPQLSDGKQVVASIDGKDFVAEELYEELRNQGGYVVMLDMINHYISDKEITDQTDAKNYADSLVKQYELSYEESGAKFEDVVVQYGYASVDAFKQIVIYDYLYNEVGEKYIKEGITEKELKEYYENHVSDELNVKHILIAPDVESTATSDEKKKAEEAALKKAKDLIKQLDEGADFDTLAKEYSDDEGSASNGGVINNVVKDKVVSEFWDAAEKLETGKYTAEPVKSKYGYHIIYKVSHTEKKSFDEIKDSLYDNVVTKKVSEDETLIEKTWVEIRKKYNLNIVDTSIKNAYDSEIKSLAD